MATVTVAEVILDVRDIDARFNDRVAALRAPLLRFLDRYQDRMMGRISRWKQDAVRAEATVSLPLGDFDAGETIAAHRFIHGGRVVFTDTNRKDEELDLVTYRHRLQAGRYAWPAYIEEPTTLKLLGVATDWTPVASIVLDYWPETTPLTGVASTFTLPGDPRDVLVAAAAKFVGERIPNLDRGRKLELAQERADAEDLYLDTVTGRHHASWGPGQET